MKTNFRKLTIAAVFAALLCMAPLANAMPQYQSVKAHAPFAFQLGAATLPAGDYEFTLIGNHLHVRNLETRKVIYAIVLRTEATRTAEISTLKFVRTNGVERLAKVQFAGLNDGVEILPMKG